MEYTSRISFPGLGIGEFEVDNVAFTIFGREIAWYAVLITTGILFCFWYVTWRSKQYGLTSDDVMDIGLVTVISGVVGGRAYYVLTSLDQYDSFWQFFEIWRGGIGIYGGLIAGGIAVYVMCRIKRVHFNTFADCVCPSILFAQMIGRFGNFFNGEAFGSQTDAFLRMGLANKITAATFGTSATEMVYVHPTFLYEALVTMSGCIIANLLFRRRKYSGFIFHFCFAWYGFGRMFIELLRTDSLYLIPGHHVWYNKISVLVGFFSFLVFGGLMVYNFIRYYKGTDEERAAMAPHEMTVEERKAHLEALKTQK